MEVVNAVSPAEAEGYYVVYLIAWAGAAPLTRRGAWLFAMKLAGDYLGSGFTRAEMTQ